ncbi:MAG: type III-A CRISPR-associated RAMP protein Csm4 [Anaerolineae bacterium]|nr:type III-A CRISPR-associated RAMP protein Csm4 [Anaerolineae bacterium]
MPHLTVYHIYPHSGFHFGQRGVELEKTGTHFPSDSLFSAFMVAAIQAGYDPEALAEQFPRSAGQPAVEPPFLLTSLFPRAGDVRFYPALPLSLMLSAEALQRLHEANRLKEVKKIAYISEALFEALCQGTKLDDWLPGQPPQLADRGVYLQGSDLWLSRQEIEHLPPAFRAVGRDGAMSKALRAAKVWDIDTLPRVTIDRLRDASNIFHAGRLNFGPQCGFWFGVEWRQPQALLHNTPLRQGFETVLHLLSDSGLGAERNIGYGHFSWQQNGEKRLPNPPADGLFVTLSRYHPRQDDLATILNDDRIAYNLVSVAGWLQTPSFTEAAQRRRRLWLFAEGSVLKMPAANAILGNLVDVRPRYPTRDFSHPVWRYGLALPIGLGGRE